MSGVQPAKACPDWPCLCRANQLFYTLAKTSSVVLQVRTLLGPAFSPSMIPDPVAEQLPSVRTEVYVHAESRPQELRAAAQSLQVTAASMQQSLHQLAMLLLKPKVGHAGHLLP